MIGERCWVFVMDTLRQSVGVDVISGWSVDVIGC